MTKQESAQRVADKLFGTERAIDEAMVEAAQLIEAMISTRRELNLSGTMGEVAQARAAEAIANLSEARRSIMATHAALSTLQRQLDVEVVGIGEKDTNTPGQTAELRVAS